MESTANLHCGMISPNVTSRTVLPSTAIHPPPTMESKKMGSEVLTRTLPVSHLQMQQLKSSILRRHTEEKHHQYSMSPSSQQAQHFRRLSPLLIVPSYGHDLQIDLFRILVVSSVLNRFGWAHSIQTHEAESKSAIYPSQHY